jgi:hypothetical protein
MVVNWNVPVLLTGNLKYWFPFFIMMKPLTTGVLLQVVAVPEIVAAPWVVLIEIIPSERLVVPLVNVCVCNAVPQEAFENISSFSCVLDGIAPPTYPDESV